MRSAALCLFIAVFSVVFYFSSVSLYPGFLMVGYGTLFTMLPVFSLVLDKDISSGTALRRRHYVRSAGAVRRSADPHRGDQLHGAHPHRADYGGAHRHHVAQADGSRGAGQPAHVHSHSAHLHHLLRWRFHQALELLVESDNYHASLVSAALHRQVYA
ncbi:unnamed protein product [Leptidea sinapis]|uniref:P-type ATPase C-terminal domain-containing protein n=1 Tax=Leptidea sinapis TaxID=189913 RepID=A0A5E4QH24_9NEOP|nr:unnamed protein product [Leptidea sinapis]